MQLICLLVAAIGSTQPAQTVVRYVNRGLAGGNNNGTSWSNAYNTDDGVRVAIAAAAPSAGQTWEIWVATGDYVPTTVTPVTTMVRSVAIPLKNDVRVYGGFAGIETSLSQRDLRVNLTRLTGDIGGSLLTDNSFHVIDAAGSNSSAVLDGFTVYRGYADAGAGVNGQGAGIRCVGGASPTIRNCVFVDNYCAYRGNAAYVDNASPTFVDCWFRDNGLPATESFGGAAYVTNSSAAKFDRCAFSFNTAARGGGLDISNSSTTTIDNCLFYENIVTGGTIPPGNWGGGAMYLSNSNVGIRNCTMVRNHAFSAVAAGVLATGSNPTIVNCLAFDNTGQGPGGSTSAPEAQINPLTLNVRYTLVEGGYSGQGNIQGVPMFDNCGPQPYRLYPTSPGVDAGSNAGAMGLTQDIAGAARFRDVPQMPDTGVGVAPLVDMGAFESDRDCNGNNQSDWCDIHYGGLPDLNADGVPDECQCSSGLLPFTYCTSKFNSQGCLPAIDFEGFASVSQIVPFRITASHIINQRTGLLFYGYQSQAVPFQGGWLCVLQPIRRTPVINSGGDVTGTNCSGAFSFDFNAHIQSGVDPSLQMVGHQVNAQWWSRDPQDPFTTNVTDAVAFAICE